MKRSEINRALREMEEFCRRERCYLPPFCSFTPEEWREKGHEYDEVRDCALGWDITDYGLGDFERVGFSLITIRNGCRERSGEYPKVYAEKLLYLREGQYSPNHFHWVKTEDIINRGGGNVLIRVSNALPDEEIDRESDVTVRCDGRRFTVPAGTQTISATTASTRPSAASRPSRRTSRPTACCAANTRRLNKNEPRIERPGRDGGAL